MVNNNYFVHFVVAATIAVLMMGAIFAQSITGTGFAVSEDNMNIEGKAEVFSVLDYWAVKKNDANAYAFNLHVYNFGNIEAKNVEMLCEVYAGDENGNIISESPVMSVRKNIGNVASTSYKIAVLEGAKDSAKEGNFPAAICSINSCEDCEILLNRIPN